MPSSQEERGALQVYDGTIIGNVYNKYDTRNPIARFLVNRFLKTIVRMYQARRARSVLEVGCGEGRLAQHLLHSGPPPERFEACDLTLAQVPPDIDSAIRFRVASVYDLPYADREFELVVCCEVLEHLDEPGAALAELARVADSAVLLSTPREPIWRLLNMARGRYLKELGNTPGHVQHFTRRTLWQLADTRLQVAECRSVLPWTILWGAPRHCR